MSASDESMRPPVAGDDARATDAEPDAAQQAGETKDAPAGEEKRPARVGHKGPAKREQPDVPAPPPSSGVGSVGPAKSKGAAGTKPATAAGARRARPSGAGPAAKTSAASKRPGAPPKATKPGASKPAPGARKPSGTGTGKPPAPAARKRQAPPKSPRGGRTEKPPAGAREKPAAGTGEKPAAGTGKKPPAQAAKAPRAAAARKPRADSAKTSPADAAGKPRAATAGRPVARAARNPPSGSAAKSLAQAKPSAPTADKVAPVPPPPAPGEGIEPPTPTPPRSKAAPAPKPAPESPPSAPDAAGAPPAGEPDAVDEPAAREPDPSGDAPKPARVADAALAYRLLTQRLRSRASLRRTHRSARPRPAIHGRIVPPDRRAELAAAAAAIAARDAGPGPAAPKPAEGTRVRLVALGVIVVLAGAMLSIFLSRSPASALSTADARFMTVQLLAADGRVRSELATLDRRDVQRARSRTRAAVATTRSLAVEIRAKNGDAAGRVHRALRRERDWLDAVGSTLVNPRSPLRDEILDRDRRLIAALAALPGDGVARRDASQQLVAYALSRALPSATG